MSRLVLGIILLVEFGLLVTYMGLWQFKPHGPTSTNLHLASTLGLKGPQAAKHQPQTSITQSLIPATHPPVLKLEGQLKLHTASAFQ